jgi:hypothetical protein
VSQIKVFSPMQYFQDPIHIFDDCKYKLLAQGDSWFSIGSLNPFNSNLIGKIDAAPQIGAVNCALPGLTLVKMVDQVENANWKRLLNDASDNWSWDALLMSGGGNDLIEAIQVTYEAAAGDPALRLLLRADEWDPAKPVPLRYVSERGWQTFSDHMVAIFDHLVQLRDADGTAAKGKPLFIHTYNLPTPRDAPALRGVSGPWLYSAVTAYGIPPADWNALSDELVGRLGGLLRSFDGGTRALPNVHVCDTAAVPLVRASAGTTGASGDWANEIHLQTSGYEKLGRAWGAAIQAVLP